MILIRELLESLDIIMLHSANINTSVQIILFNRIFIPTVSLEYHGPMFHDYRPANQMCPPPGSTMCFKQVVISNSIFRIHFTYTHQQHISYYSIVYYIPHHHFSVFIFPSFLQHRYIPLTDIILTLSLPSLKHAIFSHFYYYLSHSYIISYMNSLYIIYKYIFICIFSRKVKNNFVEILLSTLQSHWIPFLNSYSVKNLYLCLWWWNICIW